MVKKNLMRFDEGERDIVYRAVSEAKDNLDELGVNSDDHFNVLDKLYFAPIKRSVFGGKKYIVYMDYEEKMLTLKSVTAFRARVMNEGVYDDAALTKLICDIAFAPCRRYNPDKVME